MAWLLREGEVLASLEVARGRKARMRGLLGRDGIEGALLLQPCRSVHSMGLRFPIDVAFCDRDLVVVRIVRLGRFRATRPVIRAQAVIEAEAGSFARWALRLGDQLEVKE
jgi:uncharacterized protein